MAEEQNVTVNETDLEARFADTTRLLEGHQLHEGEVSDPRHFIAG